MWVWGGVGQAQVGLASVTTTAMNKALQGVLAQVSSVHLCVCVCVCVCERAHTPGVCQEGLAGSPRSGEISTKVGVDCALRNMV